MNGRQPAVAADHLLRALEHIVPGAVDFEEEGMAETPTRMAKALMEMVSGYYGPRPEEILGRTFPHEGYDEVVVVRSIPFVSLCEHHVLPFTGEVSVGYLPKNRIVGLSKIPRLVEAFSRRLQVQERMTKQIADAMDEHLSPKGLVVRVAGRHSCMSLRGVRSPGEMVTQAVRGVFREDAAARAEVLDLLGFR